MPILDSITFHEFKGLKNLELRDLGRVNLLVGNNNSGKTSILEGLSVYANPLDIAEWWLISRNRELSDRLTQNSVIDAIRWLFPQNNNQSLDSSRNAALEQGEFFMSIPENSHAPILSITASYELVEELRLSRPLRGKSEELNESEELELMQGLDVKIKIRPTIIQLSLFEDESSKHGEEKLNFQIWENEPFIRFPQKLQHQIPVALITTVSHRSESNFKLLSQAKYEDFKDDVIKLLQEVDRDILDVQILTEQGSRSSNRFTIQIEHKKLGFAPLSSFGDGIRRLFHIALNLPRIQGGMLLIDEIESAIHTEALQSSYRWLVKWCTEKDIQIFATTHSLEAVDALLDVTESDDQLVLYRLEAEEDQTHVVRHGWERLKILREELGQEVRW